jgi:hypothetical protein
MEVKFKEKKTITALSVDAISGSFALDSTPFRFEHCRERFGKMWDKSTQGFYFRHIPGKGFDIAAFVLKTEEVLGKKRFSKFSETNWDSILWIEPCLFWRCCRMRRSLFTILVRCGINYSALYDNYEEALFADAYAFNTRKAVMRFLFGFTKYKGPSIEGGTIETTGWKAIFQGKDEAYIRSALVWPRKNNPYKISHASLWN